MELRFDVKGRPYMVCDSCQTRCFFRTSTSVGGLAVLGPHIEALAAKTRDEPAYGEQVRAVASAFIAEVRRRATSGPASKATPVADAPQLDLAVGGG